MGGKPVGRSLEKRNTLDREGKFISETKKKGMRKMQRGKGVEVGKERESGVASPLSPRKGRSTPKFTLNWLGRQEEEDVARRHLASKGKKEGFQVRG